MGAPFLEVALAPLGLKPPLRPFLAKLVHVAAHFSSISDQPNAWSWLALGWAEFGCWVKGCKTGLLTGSFWLRSIAKFGCVYWLGLNFELFFEGSGHNFYGWHCVFLNAYLTWLENYVQALVPYLSHQSFIRYQIGQFRFRFRFGSVEVGSGWCIGVPAKCNYSYTSCVVEFFKYIVPSLSDMDLNPPMCCW